MNDQSPGLLYTPPGKLVETRPYQPDPARGFTIPSHYYYDEAIYREELEKIFYRSWLYVCHVEKVRNPGDYTTFQIGDQNVFVIRGKDGVLRGFYNVCQHRGHELLKGTGNSKIITCPYHAWSYHPTGELRTARGCNEMIDFDQKDFGLKPIGVEIFLNLVFVNLDPAAEPLAPQLAGLAEHLKQYCPSIEELTLAETLYFEPQANWKNVVDNFLECFHCPIGHPAFVEIVDMPTYRTVNHPLWSSHCGHAKAGGKAPYQYEGSPDDTAFGAWWIWPDLTIVMNPGCPNLVVFRMKPGGPEICKETLEFFLSAPKPNEMEQGSIDWFRDTLNPEDISLVESVQRGLHSRGYNQGRYIVDKEFSQNSEHGLHHFHSHVLKALGRI
jgi:phenylpropionate dioxygenase-like ring-hydroxylating dioxygenase large terminal subunit